MIYVLAQLLELIPDYCKLLWSCQDLDHCKGWHLKITNTALMPDQPLTMACGLGAFAIDICHTGQLNSSPARSISAHAFIARAVTCRLNPP